MGKILTDDQRNQFELINFVALCGLLGLFGVTSNTINVIIFYKQGITNYVNIGFFGLAVSDIICLVSMLWTSVLLSPLITSLGLPWYPLEVMYLTGAWPHVCFSRITSCITVYVTAERYLNIALPLKVKRIITPKTSTFMLCLIYFANIATLFPEYATSYLDWKCIASRNQTLIGIQFTDSRDSVEGVVYGFHSLLGMASFAGVILFTTLLVTKLRQSSQWRANATSSHSNRDNISNRDKKTVKMVVLIASVLIACYTPGATIALATFVVGAEFNIGGKYVNICQSTWSIACVFQCINSSVNIFIYYTMSSKYRQTFQEIFLKRTNLDKIK